MCYYKSKILIFIGKQKVLEIPMSKLFDPIYVIDQSKFFKQLQNSYLHLIHSQNFQNYPILE